MSPLYSEGPFSRVFIFTDGTYTYRARPVSPAGTQVQCISSPTCDAHVFHRIYVCTDLLRPV